MRTVSVDLGQKLKNAGLVWEPKAGDWAADDLWGEMGQVYISSDGAICLTADDVNSYIGSQELATWLPTLSDLLAELEARGWGVVSGQPITGIGRNCIISEGMVENGRFYGRSRTFEDKTREEAAGQALLWVLEKEKGESNV